MKEKVDGPTSTKQIDHTQDQHDINPAGVEELNIIEKIAHIQVPKTKQQAVNTYAQHVASTVEVEALDSNQQGVDSRSDAPVAMFAGEINESASDVGVYGMAR